MYGIARIRSRLKTPEPPGSSGCARRASVALILRPVSQHDCSVLLIHRAADPHDPWSGQIGLPGGHVDPTDADPEAAIYREAREELAVDLKTHARPLGRLEEAVTDAGGRTAPITVAPFVFELTRPVEPQPNHEVQRVIWVSLQAMGDPRATSTFTYEHGGQRAVLPCLRVDELQIWGLTLRILEDFFDRLTSDLSAPLPHR